MAFSRTPSSTLPRFSSRMALALSLLLLGLTLGGRAARAAEEFRIETKVYVGDAEEPASESMTLFRAGVVYDFLSSTGQVAVFRGPMGDKPGRFVLLDTNRKVRLELTTDQLDTLMTKLEQWAAQQSDPFLRFAAAPHYEESYDEDTGSLTLTSDLQSYHLQTQPAHSPEALAAYREFLDWYAKLNVMIHGGAPPEPRLRVNAALAAHNVVPTSIQRIDRSGIPEVRAEHAFIWRLSRQDTSWIEEINEAMTSYRLVENAEFVQPVASEELANR